MNTVTHSKWMAFAVALMAAVALNAHSDAFKPGFVDTMVQPYLDVQEALAGDNLEGAKEKAFVFLSTMEDVPEGVPSDEAKAFTGPAKEIANAEDIQSARRAFKDLSVEMISLVEHNGTSGASALYLAYCSMAFDNKGGAWIQDDKSVLNPYYGSRMLKCGSIQKQLAGENASGPHNKAMTNGHGMTGHSGKSMSAEKLAAIHAGVPGYDSSEEAGKADNPDAAGCQMSCCSKKAGN